MRNLKRTLSLLLTLAMLLGMMATGVSAAETTAATEAPEAVTVSAFKDADQITYTEEVSIMAGMGLFAGTTGGKFDPLGTVTRAQMVTVLVKALRGNEFNADAFKGADVNPFPDTAGFEGGWAEGYITAGHQMGIVGGYGDGTFQPGKAVTTAEALTMIINALGVDAGEGEWPSTIMAKAEEMKLYGSLKAKPATNAPMNREQLAVVTYEGMCHSPKGVSGYKIPNVDLVFTDIADALKACPDPSLITEVVGEDALANKVYELKTAKGFVTANQATGMDTTVIRPLKADGTLDSGVDYFVATDLDMIGHYVTVYYKEAYKSQSEPGQVYTIVDETTVMEVKETIDSSREYKAAFGKSYQVKQVGQADKAVLFDNAYNYTGAGAVSYTDPNTNQTTAYAAGSTAPAGTYFIVDGAVAGYMQPVTRYASYVVDVNNIEGSESIIIAGATQDGSPLPNNEGEDKVVEYKGIAAGDFVTYVVAQGIYVIEIVDPVQGAITKTSKTEVNGVELDVITVGGSDLVAFPGVNNTGSELDRDVSAISYGETYEVYITMNDEFIGFKTTGSINLSDIVYIVGTGNVNAKDAYGDAIITTVARCVDMDGVEKRVVLAVQRGGKTYGDPSKISLTEGFYSVADSEDKDDKKEGIQTLTPVSDNCDGGNVFVATSQVATTSFYSSGYRNLKTNDGMSTYGKTGSKYIVVNGDMSSPALEIAVIDSLVDFTETMKRSFELLVTRAAAGTHNLIEVMVITGMSPSQVTAGTGAPIYVTAEQIANSAQTADGHTYQVHKAADGTVTEIIVDKNAPLAANGAGFYSMSLNDDGLSTLTPVGYHASIAGQNAYVRQNVGILGLYAGRDLKASNVDWTLGYNSSAAVKVVDTRSDTQIAQENVARITSSGQLISLIEQDNTISVVADLYVNDPSGGDDKVQCIYVTSVLRNTPGLNSVLYSSILPDAAGGTIKMVQVRTTQDSSVNKEVTVNYASATGASEGFYQYCIGSDGKPSLQQITVNSGEGGNPGSFGQHNKVTAVDVAAGTITTEDIHTGCGITCVHANEALKGVLTIGKKTPIYDKDGSTITLKELADRLGQGEELAVNYYCSGSVLDGDAATDNTPEVIFLYDTSAAQLSYHTEHSCGHAEHDAITDWTPLSQVLASAGVTTLSSGGNYYLDADVTLTANAYLKLDTTDKIVLCLNGKKITREASVNFYAVRFNKGCHFVLCDCSQGQTGTVDVSNTNGKLGASNAAVIGRAAGTFDLYGGTVIGGVCVAASATDGTTFNMYGGTVKPATGMTDAIFTNSNLDKVFISGGHMDGGILPKDGTTPTISITGGTFTQNPAQYLAAGYGATENGGVWTVAQGGPAPTVYNVTVGQNITNGTVTVDPTSGVAGVTVTVTATPDAGYVLKEILKDGQPITGTTFQISGDHTVTATFEQEYTVTVDQSITNGTVTVDPTSGVAGTTVAVTATPDAGYKLTKIMVDTTDITDTKSFTISGNHTVTATFEQDVATYTVTVDQNITNGTVTVDPTSGPAGTTVTVTATPATGYVLTKLMVDTTDITTTKSFTITGNHTVTATFDEAHVHSCTGGHTVPAGTQWIKLDAAKLASILDETGTTPIYRLKEAGHYYLADDVEMTAKTYLSIETAGETTLCLNGKTIARKDVTGNNYVIRFGGKSSPGTVENFTLCDCVGGGKLDFSAKSAALSASNAAVMCRVSGNTFNMYGGTIIGGVAVVDGTVNMYGGTVKAVGTEDVIFVQKSGGTINVTGGDFEGVSAAPEVLFDKMSSGKTGAVNLYNDASASVTVEGAQTVTTTYQLTKVSGTDKYALTLKP